MPYPHGSSTGRLSSAESKPLTSITSGLSEIGLALWPLASNDPCSAYNVLLVISGRRKTHPLDFIPLGPALTESSQRNRSADRFLAGNAASQAMSVGFSQIPNYGLAAGRFTGVLPKRKTANN